MVKTLVDPIPAIFTDTIPNNKLHYEFAVSNTGNITIPATDVLTIDDNRIDAADITCPAIPAGGLPPIDPDGDGVLDAAVEGVNQLTCTATYTIVAADLELGSVTNIATANTPTTGDSAIDDAIFPANATPALSLTKTATAGLTFDAPGDVITYEFDIQNTGGAGFTQPITITDDKDLTIVTTVNGTPTSTFIPANTPFVCWAATATDTSFAPDATFDIADTPPSTNGETATCTATYIVTQADVDAGQVDNVAIAETEYPAAGAIPVSSQPADESVFADQSPMMEVVKTAAVGAIQSDGSFDVTFSLTTTNTGNVTLSDLTLFDDLDTQYGAGVVAAVLAQPSVSVAPALAGSVSPGSPSATYTGGATSLVGTGGVLMVGDSYTATFTVKIDATVLPAPISLENTATAGATLPVPADGSIPGTISDESENGAEVPDDGDPSTAIVTDGTDPDPADSDTHIPTVITFDALGEVALVKAAVLDTNVVGSANGEVGDQIIYTYTVTNTDPVLNALNVVVTENAANFTGDFSQLTIPVQSSNGIDLDGSGGLNDLAPGESLTFTATYTLVQSDIDNGMVDNQAAVDAADPFGNDLSTISDNDASADGEDGTDASAGADGTGNSTLVMLQVLPGIELVKSVSGVDDTNGNGVFGDIGDIVNFEFTVANTGNVSLAGISVTDTGFSALTGTSVLTPTPGFDGTLTPGEGLVTPVLAATATYEVTETDAIAQEIENSAMTSATAVGNDGNGNPDLSQPIAGVPVVEDTSDTGSDPDLDFDTGDVPQVGDPSSEGTEDDPTILYLPELVETNLILTKSTSLETVVLGTSVPYTITIENDSAASASVNLVDTLPVDLVYTPGSGLIDGVPTEPTVSGRVLTWPVSLSGFQTV
ncbi:hypothetical protein N9O61_06510, partial [Octadecabacter sp.]|nr:hypothetical protein [Octadecabacter sp.]